MTFGEAIEAAKQGKRIQRGGWNGKGMWVAYTPPSVLRITPPQAEALADMAGRGVHPSTADVHLGGLTLRGAAGVLVVAECPMDLRISGHLDMRAADGSLVVGWLASQTDMLADDWSVLE